MATGTPSQQELINQILASSAGLKATETAIFDAMKSFTEATSTQVTALVQSNTIFPEMREDVLKLEKGVMEMTLEAIKAIQSSIPEPPNPKTKK